MDRSKSDSSSDQPLNVDDIIAHYGVLGMHWGVRKRENASSGPTDVTLKTRKPGKKLKTAGGQYHPATADATRHAVAKQTAKKSSTDSLSDKELKDLVNRMNMEQQYNRMRTDPGGVGARFAAKLIGSVGNQQSSKYANDKVSSAIEASAAKKALRAAQVAKGLKLAMG